MRPISRVEALAMLGAVLPVLNRELGLHIPTDQIIAISGVKASYVLGRSHVKAKAG